MEFSILGPLRVTGDDAGVLTPRGVEARLLALLLLEPRQAWSVPRLVDGVWDGEPPATAERQVRNLVSVLRKRLGAERIGSVGGGYRLNAAAAEIDAQRFTELVRQAQDARSRDEPGTTLDLLRRALDLWRGEPLSGMRGRLVEAATRQLTEARMAALEDRVDLELELGQPGPVVPLLRQVLDEHPYRQRAAGQLMLALHRLERTPEALGVYEQIRSRLAEDLGLDPGEQLRQRQQAVLRGETTAARPAEPAARVPAPAQLPARPSGFVGRAGQLEALDGLLAGPAHSCVVTGAAGSGKTALAVHWSHGVRDRFPDGQLFINLRGFDPGEPVTVADALGRLIRSLLPTGLTVPDDIDEATAMYRTLLHDKRILVVLDNARDAAQVRPLLSPGDNGFTLITSRHRLSGLTALNAVPPLELPPLSAAESIEVLSAGGRRRLDPGAADRLAGRCGRLPLALRIAAAQLASRPGVDADDLAAQLTGPAGLDALSLDGDPGATVATALELSFRHLDAASRELFLTLGLLPGEDYPRELIAAVCRPAARLLNRLEAVHLLEQHRPGRYRFHDLTRLYAAGQAHRQLPADTAETAVDRFIDWHFDRRDDENAAEDANLLSACETLAGHRRLWRLVTPLARRATGAGRLERIREFIDAACANADLLGQCYLASTLASYHWALDQGVEAVAAGSHAVALAEELDDDEALWMAKGQLGLCLFGAGRFTEAAVQLEQSLALTPPSADWHRRFNRRLNLSVVRAEMGQYDQAGTLHRDLVREAAQRHSPEHEFRAAAAAAWLSLDTGDLTAARDLATTALTGARAAGHRRYECELRKLLGVVHARTGAPAEAEHEFDKVIDIARQIQRPSFEIEALGELARLHSRAGDHDRARHCLKRLPSPPPDDPADPISVAEIALTRGVVHHDLGEHRLAIEHGTLAERLNAAIPRPLHQARSLAVLAEAHAALTDHTTARRLRDRAVAILEALGLSDEAEQLNPAPIDH